MMVVPLGNGYTAPFWGLKENPRGSPRCWMLENPSKGKGKKNLQRVILCPRKTDPAFALAFSLSSNSSPLHPADFALLTAAARVSPALWGYFCLWGQGVVITSFHRIRFNTATERQQIAKHPQHGRTDPHTYFHFLPAWVVGSFLTTMGKKTMKNEPFFSKAIVNRCLIP